MVIAGYLLINLAIGIYYRRRAGGNTEEFFVSGRNVSWWLAGTSMVATTFAADTPLFVSGVIATQGIAGNWIWWTSCLGGMLTVFFFARYWRRAEVLTDVELTEMRYSGKPAAFLRGFKAIYLGLVDELLDPGLGDQCNGQYYRGAAGAADCARARCCNSRWVDIRCCITRWALPATRRC